MAEKRLTIILSGTLALYIIAAIAFECTANTAIISTIAIYLVFVVGLLYLFMTKRFFYNEHCLSIILMLAYICIMTFFNHNAISDTVVYYFFTCAVLCLIGYSLFICINREQITAVCLGAFVFGALILVIRIVINYGGIAAIFEFAKNGVNERRIGRELLNENTLGLYMANAFTCCLVIYEKHKVSRPCLSRFVLLLSPLFVIILLLTASKKAVLFLVLGFAALMLFILCNKHEGKKAGAFILTCFGIYLIILLIRNVPAFRSISLRFNSFIDIFSGNDLGSDSDQTRYYMISQGFSAFFNSPIIGNGTAYSYVLFGTYSHNNFVEILMNYGVVGFTIYYFPYLFLLPRLVRLVREKDFYALYFLIFVTMQIILGIAWVNYYERITQLFTVFAVGYSEEANKKRNRTLRTCKYFREIPLLRGRSQ